MNTSERATAKSDRTIHDDQTSLPLFRTWPSVYWLVAGSFLLWIVLLVVLGKSFS